MNAVIWESYSHDLSPNSGLACIWKRSTKTLKFRFSDFLFSDNGTITWVQLGTFIIIPDKRWKKWRYLPQTFSKKKSHTSCQSFKSPNNIFNNVLLLNKTNNDINVTRWMNWPTCPMNTTLTCSFLGASGWVGGALGAGASSSSSIIPGGSWSGVACISGPLSPPPGSSSSGSASFWSHGSSVLSSVSPFSRADSAKTQNKEIKSWLSHQGLSIGTTFAG